MSILSHLDANPGPILTTPTSTRFQSEAIFKPTPILANPVLFQSMPIRANPSQSKPIHVNSVPIQNHSSVPTKVSYHANPIQFGPIQANPDFLFQ